MKKALLFLLLIPFAGHSQTIRVSTQDGDFLNPLNWSPVGVPASGDSLTVNHNMTMTTDIYYTAGRITISPSGSLVEDATDRAFWADGTGSLVNSGTFVSHLLLASPGAFVNNIGTFTGVDSVWNQGTMSNTGTMLIYDILNDEQATLTNENEIIVENNMNNQGSFMIIGGGRVTIQNDFSNCNTQSMDARMSNNGTVCITNDFSNCPGDTLAGSGNYFVGGSSSNLGVFTGSFTFYTPSGTMGVSGTINPGVTIAQGTCNIGLEELKETIEMYPNPAEDFLNITTGDASYQVYDVTGKTVLKGTVCNEQINVSNLTPGVYTLQIEGYTPQKFIKK